MNNLKHRTIAITGVDGSGKSTITKKFIEKNPAGSDSIIVLSYPLFHETPNVPLATLSKELACFSSLGDELMSFELKGIAQFVQASLFGPVQDFMIRTFQPSVMIHERNPVVDSIAYGNFYIRLLQKNLDKTELEPVLQEKLNSFNPGAYDNISQWIKTASKRYGTAFDLWNIDDIVKSIFSRKGKDLINELMKYMASQLPDVILVLEADAETVESRVRDRDGEQTELHEKSDFLEQIRREYRNAIELFNSEFPDIETHIINTGDAKGVDRTLNEVMERMKF